MAKESVACIAFEDGKIFVARRIQSGDMGGRWEFPGGKVEPGETPEHAAVREIREEFGCDVSVTGTMAEGHFVHRGEDVALHVVRIKFTGAGISPEFTLPEHTSYMWTDPYSIPSMDFVDSDMAVYSEVMKSLGLEPK